ncbi:MAG: phosphatase PAP2 family protein, partial [Ignavibacteriales bacterium]|nr:phosphatase PAP2 family protein [Ignavibacteriales bacterium]
MMNNTLPLMRLFFCLCVLTLLAGSTPSAYGFQSLEITQTCFDNEEPLLPKKLEGDQPTLSVATLQNQPLPSWHQMFTRIPSDWYRTGKNILQIESIPQVLGLAALTGTLIVTDRQTWPATRNIYKHSEDVHTVSDYMVALGDGSLHFGIAGTFAAYGFLAGDNRALRTASQTVEAVLATGIVVQALKRVTGRESPIASSRHRGRWKFFPNLKKYHENEPAYYAFPSGHISTAMATLTVISENYPEQRWIKPVGYSMVGLLGVGLVAKGMHWYSDLPLGIALGYMLVKTISTPEGIEVAKTTGVKPMQMTLS